jgi:hypothetical protein
MNAKITGILVIAVLFLLLGSQSSQAAKVSRGLVFPPPPPSGVGPVSGL